MTFTRTALRDVAYHGLPFRVRRELHGRVAAATGRGGAEADADPAVLSLHWLLAGDHARARRLAVLGAQRAAARSAHADAARLYRRAIEAGRSEGAAPEAMAAHYETLAESLRRTGQPEQAGEALAAARRLVAGDRLAEARLLHAHAEIAARRGRLSGAVRWVNRGLAVLGSDDGDAAACRRVLLLSTLASVRQAQGRAQAAAALCRQVIERAGDVGERRALAHAYYVLDWALVELGRPWEATHSPGALEIYRELGDQDQEAIVLNNQGMFAYFRGEWDEAIRLYDASAAAAVRAGNDSYPAYADTNIGEILSDQGRHDAALVRLRRARRVWGATGDAQAAAFVDVLLGRLAVRDGRQEEGLALLEAGARELERLGLDGYAEFAGLLVVEAEAYRGDPVRALARARAVRGAVADRHVSLLYRCCGVAHGRLRDVRAAEDELHAALTFARERSAAYDIAAALDALAWVGHPATSSRTERKLILDQLAVQRLLVPAPDASGAGTAAALTA